MAAASLTVLGEDGKVLRTFGGNRKDVRNLKHTYESMKVKEFLSHHTQANINDYHAMQLIPKYNKN